MRRKEKLLTARACAAPRNRGRLSDGGGLYLDTAKGGSQSWVWQFTFAGRSREMGLGAFPLVPLADARSSRDDQRKILQTGRDPIEARRAGIGKTFGEAAEAAMEAKSPKWRNPVHAAQWRTTLETYAAPLWDTPVDQVGTEAVLAVLTPLWRRIPETASRLRGRIEAVLSYAKARGWRAGENPALWRGHLDQILAPRGKRDRGHHAALHYNNVAEFIAGLRERRGASYLAFEFLILTAARSGEATGARWDEIDLDAKIWSVPANRMKSGAPHRVPLSDRAIEILRICASARTNEFVFQGRLRDRPLGPKALHVILEGLGATATITVHGFRSAFRDWAGNETSFPRELAEQALAHSIGDSTEQAYRRSDAIERRRSLMNMWEKFCTANKNVVALRPAG
jgi:integrase